MSAIGQVWIKAVRGIRAELPIDLQGRSLLLRGDNGSGKSSIAQALQWALAGAPASSTNLPPEFQRHRLVPDPSACHVIIDLVPTGRIVMRGGALDEAATDAAGHAFVDACVRSNPFLRRDELLGILADSPSDRFKYFEGFLDLEAVERLLGALAATSKGHETAAKDAGASRARLIAGAAAHLPAGRAAPQSIADLLSHVFATARALGVTPDEAMGFDALAPLRATLGLTNVRAAAIARRNELAGAIGRARALVPPSHPSSVLVPLRAAERSASETDLAALLTEALAAVEMRPTDESCPVCEQSVRPRDLVARLRARMALLNEVRGLRASASALGRALHAFFEAVEICERVASGAAGPPTVYASERALLDELDASDGETLAARSLARLETVRTELVAEHGAIPDELRASEIEKLGAAIDAVLGARSALSQSEAELERHTTAAQQLRAVEKAVSDGRKDVATETLDGIQSLVASYYERIHPPGAPDEVTGAPTIRVKRHGSGTAHVLGQFNNEEVADPRLVYSDGHLDTVGICIFLALRKRSAANPKLLVLDDIVLSIDMGHAARLIELLRDEFGDHQILLLSHNALFMKMCRAPFSNARHLEIHSWTLEHGPRLVAHVTHIEHLRKALDESGSAETVANAMRPVLDDLLQSACRSFEVAVPTTQGRGLTVDEQWSPLRKKLIELTKAGALGDLTATFEKIGSPSFFRNALGAHLNDWALDVPLAQVQRISQGILELVEAVHCTVCNIVVRPANPRVLSQGLACDCRGGAQPSISNPSTKPEES